MDPYPTLEALLQPGGPLAGVEAILPSLRLDRPVTWAVSLRPYSPAIPPLKGGELALTSSETLSKQEISLASTVARLAQLGASGLVVRGDVDSPGMAAALRNDLPLLRAGTDAALADLEQAVIHECALHQARREVAAPPDPTAWIDDLLSGRRPLPEVEVAAARTGYSLPPLLMIAFLLLEGKPHANLQVARSAPPLRRVEGGLAVLLPPDHDMALRKLAASIPEPPAGVGLGTPLAAGQAARSLSEARLAAVVSARLRGGQPVSYARMGVDGMLAALLRDSPHSLRAFVEEVLGPMIRHDARYATKLLPTLRSYVEHAGRLRETAVEVHVHRNTLAYRLERAQEILEVDLRSSEALVSISLALKAMRLLGM